MGNTPAPPGDPDPQPCPWVNTEAMARALGIHRSSLMRLRHEGYLTEGVHFRKAVPISSKKPRFLWHYQRVAEHMNAL